MLLTSLAAICILSFHYGMAVPLTASNKTLGVERRQGMYQSIASGFESVIF